MIEDTKEPPKVATRRPRKAPTKKPPQEPVEAPKVPEVQPQLPLAEPPPVARKAAPEDPFKKDFRKFLWAVWKHLLKEEPTPLHYDIAKFLQHGPQRMVIMGFRGMSKSWITVAFVLWLLYCDNQRRILVVSGNATSAKEFTRFCLDLMREMPLIQHLYPNDDGRRASDSFDVAGAKPDKAPSVKARGITGQITGSRADVIVADDVETSANSLTVAGRADISERIKEFGAIVKPLDEGGRIIYLGTPQTEASIYNGLPERGYTIRIWPAEVPDDARAEYYGSRLSPYVRAMMAAGKPPGSPVEPIRFPAHDLTSRRLEYGVSGYSLQFMLDTRQSDAEKYPLKLRDLIVMALDPKRGPESVAWGADPQFQIKDLPVIGHNGDAYYRPIFVSSEFQPWSGVRAFIDPSGRGSDETGYSVVAELHGRLFVLAAGGFRGGYDPATLTEIAETMVRWGVSRLFVESNFGDGMFTSLLQPYLNRAWVAHNRGKPEAEHGGTTLEEIRHSGVQKELRIISLLEPLMNQHRLVVNQEVIERDWRETDARSGDRKKGYSLAYQMSYLTKERGCLPHDDRIEAIAGGVEAWADTVTADPEEMAQQAAQERLEEWIEEWMEGPLPGGRAGFSDAPRGAGRWGASSTSSPSPQTPHPRGGMKRIERAI